METNSLPNGMFSPVGNPGMLGLELLPHPSHQQNPSPSELHHHHSQLVPFGHHETDLQSQSQQKSSYPYASKTKQHQQLDLSDDDEPGLAPEDSGDGKRKISPWQRMKWTDTMVRLLIMAVYYIGDEAVSEGAELKKKAGGILQKKGKWKSVSRAMMEKGFYVSPQQCEDKFNDLNKRYKRVNDILGKGTACKVVENQGLLEGMDHLSPKMKEEAKKLLNSKHLFFREMCAYHNSCVHGATSSHNLVDLAPQQQQQQQRCFHSSQTASMVPNYGRAENELSKEDEEDENEDDEEEDEDEEGEVEGSGGRGNFDHGDDAGDCDGHRSPRRRQKRGVFPPPLTQKLRSELDFVLQDGGKGALEKKQWVKGRLVQLEEQSLNYQYRAFELEKQRLKWVKFSSKKEREMERERLKNERERLESERMILLLRQKEMELLDLQQQMSNKRGDPSTVTG